MYKLIRSPIEKASILVFEATIKLFELKLIVSFETRVDMGVGDKIEVGGHWFIVKRRIASYLFIGREVASCITKNMVLKNKYLFLENK